MPKGKKKEPKGLVATLPLKPVKPVWDLLWDLITKCRPDVIPPHVLRIVVRPDEGSDYIEGVNLWIRDEDEAGDPGPFNLEEHDPDAERIRRYIGKWPEGKYDKLGRLTEFAVNFACDMKLWDGGIQITIPGAKEIFIELDVQDDETGEVEPFSKWRERNSDATVYQVLELFKQNKATMADD